MNRLHTALSWVGLVATTAAPLLNSAAADAAKSHPTIASALVVLFGTLAAHGPSATATPSSDAGQ